MKRNLQIALVGFAVIALVGFGLSMVSAQVDVGKQAYIDYGCFDCHGNFDNGGTIADRDPNNPNALGGMAPAIVGWNVDNLKDAVYDGLYQNINYFKTEESRAQVYTEAELSDSDLADITAFLNPNFTDGNAANGQTLYAATCQLCHGEDALGNAVGPALVYKQFETIKAVARTGILPVPMQGLMPTYNGQIDEATLQAISDYLISLDQR
jgi:hypothetical protein